MPLVQNYLFPAMWLSFLAYWWAISRNVKETERRESAPSRIARLVLIVGDLHYLVPTPCAPNASTVAWLLLDVRCLVFAR